MDETKTTTPPCPYFGSCGGCTAQHIAYSLQLENKKNLVFTHLKKNGIADLKEIEVFHDSPYSYRTRMDFAISREGLALRKKDQFSQFVKIGKCKISSERINTLLHEVQEWFSKNSARLESYASKSKTGCLKYATIRSSKETDSTSITFILNEESGKVKDHLDLIREFAKTTSALKVCAALIPASLDSSASHEAFPVKGSLELREIIEGKSISFSSQGFFQNNTAMAQKMVHYCREALSSYAHTKNATLIDLYGGAGTFGVPLGDLFEKTIIIDSEGPNIVWAKRNLEANRVKGETYAADAGILSRLPIPANKEVFLIADPPRSGMHEKVIRRILDLDPKCFIYVSCNPMQMAKELRHFVKRYFLKSAAVFDLFPQTVHVEAIAVMERKG